MPLSRRTSTVSIRRRAPSASMSSTAAFTAIIASPAGKRFSAEYIKENAGIPRCGCGGIIKPDVVLYGEPLDENTILGAVRAIASSDLLIVAGTSLSVYPAASFLNYFRGEHLVLINRDKTPLDGECELVIHEKVGEVFSTL